MKVSLAAVVLALALAATPALAADDATDLGPLVTQLTGDDANARKDAAKKLEELGSEAVPAIAKELATLRKTSAAGPAVKAATKEAKEGGELEDALVTTK